LKKSFRRRDIALGIFEDYKGEGSKAIFRSFHQDFKIERDEDIKLEMAVCIQKSRKKELHVA